MALSIASPYGPRPGMWPPARKARTASDVTPTCGTSAPLVKRRYVSLIFLPALLCHEPSAACSAQQVARAALDGLLGLAC